MAKILITGAAGFIGFHLCRALLAQGEEIIGIDNLNDYYDVSLKEDRLKLLTCEDNFSFHKENIALAEPIMKIFADTKPDLVVHLAAQAGVRYSLINPRAYVDSNLVGFVNMLEACRHHGAKHLVFASSSSVYGANTLMPFSVQHNVDHPVSLYAATKKANELIAHSYSSLYGIPTTGLRFFTVYGPWGRPDMAYYSFTRSILAGKTIEVFNYGEMLRDFTYVDDIVAGIMNVLGCIPCPNPDWQGNSPDAGSSYAPYRIYNIGNNQPVKLLEFIRTLEGCLGLQAKLDLKPMQAGDVVATFADIDDLIRDTGFKPITPISTGLANFVQWYHDYYGEGGKQPA